MAKKKTTTLLETKTADKVSPDTISYMKPFRIQSIKNLTGSTYILQVDKHDMSFTPGQHIALGIPKDRENREYSIYSPSHAPYLQVLIKEVKEGDVSIKLHQIRSGFEVSLEGPFGFFTLPENNIHRHKFLFVATGTGIAPFHSMVGSYSEFDYKLLHGVRYAKEAYEKEFYEEDRYILCTSKDDRGDYQGRVTDYIKNNPVDSNTLVYLCGNSNMIYDVYDILSAQGFNTNHIFTEVYF